MQAFFVCIFLTMDSYIFSQNQIFLLGRPEFLLLRRISKVKQAQIAGFYVSFLKKEKTDMSFFFKSAQKT